MNSEEKPASFNIEGVEFCHWDFSYKDGWKNDAWIASATIEATDFVAAINLFRTKLSRLVPRISLIVQSYIDFTIEPFMVHSCDTDFAYFHYIEEVGSVGLMFTQNEQQALTELCSNQIISDHFFYYWNDAVNTTGYTPKLLLMFSAVESLVKKNGRKDWGLINEILGPDLVQKFFGTQEEPNTGLRHRLVHGEYFNENDGGENYLELLHKKIIQYFNSKIFGRALIQENVERPQRHFFGNKQEGRTFIRNKDGSNRFSLIDLLNDFDSNGFRSPKKYDHLSDKKLHANY